MAVSINMRSEVIIVTGTTGVDTIITDEKILVQAIYWFNPTTVGHLVNLTDKHGNTLFPMRCEVENGSQMWQTAMQTVDGLHYDDMDSGTLYIYFETLG